jgi:curved DNA-binding protein
MAVVKYKDYYAILGLERGAAADDVKRAYRKLARKYHPDVSKEKDAEEKFKEVNEAYQTLSDAAKRAAYDDLGSHRPGEEFRPPPDWGERFGAGGAGGAGGAQFDEFDLSDLFERAGVVSPCPARTTRWWRTSPWRTRRAVPKSPWNCLPQNRAPTER